MAKLYEFEGELLTARTIAGKVDLAPSTIYKYLNQGFSIYDSIELGKKMSQKVFKNREKTNNQQAKKYPYQDGKYTVEEISKMEELSSDAIYQRLKQGYTPEEAIKIIKGNKARKYPFQDTFLTLNRISIITGVSRFYLKQYLSEEKSYTQEEVERIVSSYQKPDILMVGNQTLIQYCYENQYNYDVIFYLVKQKDMTVEEAIDYYQRNGQSHRFKCIFILGEILLSHFFIKEKLSDRYINNKIREGFSIEDAITSCIFLSHEEYATRGTRNKLYDLYKKVGLEGILADDTILPIDKDFVKEKDKRVKEVLYHYNLYEVFTLLPEAKTDEERKLILDSHGLRLEDLMENDDLFENFELVKTEKAEKTINYVWRSPS